MGHNESERISCLVEWCINAHSDDEIIEQEFFHSKAFGVFDDSSLGVIKVGASQRGNQFVDTEVLIETLEMTTSKDLRDLAKDCLEAAEWMENNLISPAPLRLIG